MTFALDLGRDVCLVCQAQGDPTPEAIEHERLRAADKRRVEMLRDLKTR